MFCTKCGNEIKDGLKFCTNCGTKVEEDEIKTEEPVKSEESKTEIIGQEQFHAQLPTFESPVENNGKKSSGIGVRIAIIIVLIFVVIGLLGLSAFLFLFNEDTKIMNFEFNGFNSSHQIEDDNDELEREDSEDSEDETDDVNEADSKDDSEETEESKVAADDDEDEKPFTGKKQNINIEVRQVDNSNFPEMTLYTSITDSNGEVVKNLAKKDFDIQEIDKQGNVIEASIEDMYQVLNEDKISIELVMDASGSMDSDSKMNQAKNAANSLVNNMNLKSGDQIEVISFDDFVYLQQSFTSQSTQLTSAIDGIETGNSTALFDGIYAGLYQTNLQSGAKCVIAFTDGEENASSYSFNDVVSMAQNTGIPVFIIGIGSEYEIDEYQLEDLASQCSGKYYSANNDNLESILEDIYMSIYKEQQNYYVVKYKTTNTSDRNEFRDVVLQTSETSEFTGYYKKSYVPETDLSGAFSDDYSDVDFIIPESSNRKIDYSDIDGLSLAELRIARNEIFARHGRQFNDPLLNQWFYSKTWYLDIDRKYSPTDFDKYNPNPLSRLEQENAEFIKSYENDKMAYEDIFPDASRKILSDYDLALSKPVLKEAMKQLNYYTNNDILMENKKRIQAEIDKEDVKY